MNHNEPDRISNFFVIGFLPVIMCATLLIIPSIAQAVSQDTTTFKLPDGFTKSKIYANIDHKEHQFAATFFKMENMDVCKIIFVSRQTFKEAFSFENIENQCREQHEQIVLQVAAAFTPDWKVIEGFALQDGQKVGQDSFPGKNKKLFYKGLLLIKDGYTAIDYLDSLQDRDAFIADAVRNKCSLFQQVAAIVNGNVNTKVDLPGTAKRRFFVEIVEDHQSKFGIVSFHLPTKFSEAVEILTKMNKDNFTVKNALYLDMGAVSEGYVYDNMGEAHLIGDPHKDISRYTNLLVMYKNNKQ